MITRLDHRARSFAETIVTKVELESGKWSRAALEISCGRGKGLAYYFTVKAHCACQDSNRRNGPV